jgi:TetR/AcrR family tetracycline transcriptional repressor
VVPADDNAAARTPAITREALAAAGMAVLRREGLDALSMRKVAAELGVRAASLYYHVQDKEQLLDLVADSMVWGAHKLARAGDWTDCLRDAAHGYYRHLHANRDAARLMAGRRAPGPNLLYVLDVMLGRLHGAGFSDADAAWATLTITTYVQGFVLQEQQPKPAHTERAACSGQDFDQYPNLRTFIDAIVSDDSQELFSFGVERIIDGLRARLHDARQS